jgi:adenylosuccinate lyase
MKQYSADTYLSPFTWRYGTDEMRQVWSVYHQREIWRKIWVSMAEVQCDLGLVSEAQVQDLRANAQRVDLARAAEIEAEIRHDVMAEVKAYAEQCPVGGGIVHLGATSMDVQDNADAIRLHEALDLVLEKTRTLMTVLAQQIEALADHPTMAFTHLQPAEPTTLGYRLAQYGQDLLCDFEAMKDMRHKIKGKGFKGAAGTSASYLQLFGGELSRLEQFQNGMMEKLNIEETVAAIQTAPRKQEYQLVSVLSGLGQTLYKMAFDFRILQSPVIGELAEPFGKKQVGSSAMPFKRNPIDAENIDSLARLLATYPRVMWDNAAHSLLERTLDDSANRRTVLAESFLLVDEMIKKAQRILSGLRIDSNASEKLMDVYGPFAATERLMMEAVKRGGDRQVLHEVIREHALRCWADLAAGRPNELEASLAGDERLTTLMDEASIYDSLRSRDYVGDAPVRARRVAVLMKLAINGDKA